LVLFWAKIFGLKIKFFFSFTKKQFLTLVKEQKKKFLPYNYQGRNFFLFIGNFQKI